MPVVPLLLLAVLAALDGGRSLDRRVTLGAVGDIQLAVNMRHPEELPGGDPFALVREALAADLTVGNLEGPLAAPGAREAPGAHGPILRQPPNVGALLRDAGFELVSLANNHLLDWGVPSVLATLEHLRRAGLEPVGAWPDPADGFQPVIRTVRGVSVGFLAYSMWLNVPDGRRDVGLGLLRTDDAVAEIAALRPYVDFVVVLAHWERENDHFTYGVTRELAHAMVDAGADVVLGHHAHVLKGLEWYRGALIAYSLGNFVFGQVRGAQAEGAVLQLELVRQADGGRRIADARLVPVVLEGPRSIPRPAEGRRRQRLLTRLRGWSRPLETLVEADGRLWPRSGRPHDPLAPRLRAWLAAAGGAR